MTTSASIVPEVQAENTDRHHFQQQMGRVTKHSLVFFLGTIFNGLAAYVFKVYLARRLGAKALGIYALGMTIVGIVSVFNTLGISQAAVRFVSAYTATQKLDLLRGFLGRSLLLLLASSGVLAAAMLLAGPAIASGFYHTPELRRYMGLFTLIMVLGVFTTFLGHVLSGYKDIARRTVINNFIGSPAVMLMTVLLIAAGFGLRGYIAAQALGAFLVLGLLGARAWRLTPAPARSFSGNLAPVEKEVVSLSVTTLGLALLGFAMSQTDVVIVGHYRGAHELGVYAVAGAIVAFVAIILSSVNQIFAPTIADIYARGQHDLLLRMFQTLTKWILGLSLPLAAVIVIFAVPIMRIFGKDFELGWPVLVIGAIGQLVNCGVGSSGTLLYMTGHQRYLIRIHAVAAALMVFLSVLLVPRWGIVGAGLAAALTTIAANLLYLGAARRALGLIPYNRSYLRLVLPSAGMLGALLVVWWTVGRVAPPWLTVAVALSLAYGLFIGLALLFGLDPDDRLVARAIWTRLRAATQNAEVIA
jgi:O-antigen/teichoic acid export membrane protein